MTQTDGVTGENAVRCSTCGSDIHERAEICPECGTRQRAPPEENEDDTSVLAAVISVPFPGIGHMFHRQFGRGLAFMIAFYGGYFLLNMVLGAPLEFLLFGVWGYAIYDAYTKGWESDEPEPDRRGAGTGATADPGWNESTSKPSATATASSGTPNSTPDVSDAEQPGSPTQSSAPDATSERAPTVDNTMTDSDGAAESTMADSETAPESTMAGSKAAAESTTVADDVEDVQESDGFEGTEESDDDDDEDAGSKWSRDDSDRSWGRD